MTTFLMALLLLAGKATVAVCCQQLEDDRSITLFLKSRRNSTGHWKAQVTLKHGGSEDSYGRAVDVAVDHRTGKCDNQEIVTIQVNLSAAPARAGPDYELYPGLGYYKLHTEPRKWREALSTCSAEDAHLAVVNSEQEANVLKEMLRRHSNISGSSHQQHAFIGFHDLISEGLYTTVLGEPLNSTGFVKWVSGQPNNAGYDGDPDSDCGGVDRAGLLNDLPCNWKLPFFCEQQLWDVPETSPQ